MFQANEIIASLQVYKLTSANWIGTGRTKSLGMFLLKILLCFFNFFSNLALVLFAEVTWRNFFVVADVTDVANVVVVVDVFDVVRAEVVDNFRLPQVRSETEKKEKCPKQTLSSNYNHFLKSLVSFTDYDVMGEAA